MEILIKKIENSQKTTFEKDGFKIQILFPGKGLESNDTGIGTIGRIDHADVSSGTLVPMHPHADDEILTYVRTGNLKHKDSEGLEEKVSNKRLMMMNAGKLFYHEELALKNGRLRGLQIFIRPEKQGLKPNVQFHNFLEVHSVNTWRLVAGQDKAFPLHIRSKTSIYDIRLEAEKDTVLPEIQESNPTLLFYVFDGKVSVNENIELTRGESIIIKNEKIKFKALQRSDIVLFVTDEDSVYFEDGMYSGNQHKDDDG